MPTTTVTIKGLKEFESAIKRNPNVTLREVGKFLTQSIAEYNRSIIRNPWTVYSNGGGAPVDTGNLRDTHRREINKLSARIYPTANYSQYVHGNGFGEINSRNGVKSRPWLDYAVQEKERAVQMLGDQMIENIINDLAR